MRKILGPLALLVAVLGAGPSSFAQSPYDYPYCSIRGGRGGGGGGQSCYFTSYAQCMASLSGIGGTCIRNPGYRGSQRGSSRYERY
jgi:Protein of unknown function (DUF3551)